MRCERLVSLLIAVLPVVAHAQQDAGSRADETDSSSLAKKLNNPIADLVSIPFQFNWNTGVGPQDELQLVLNIQPVIPVSITKDWNLIGRFIVPFTSQPAMEEGGQAVFGMSDITASLFLSPSKPSAFVWGVGPAFGLPTTTDPALGSGKWLLGPTAVALLQAGPWTVGALTNQLWSFAGTGDIERASVSRLFVQPFVAHTTKTATTFTAMSETTIDWKEPKGQRWTAPVELFVSQMTKLGTFPFNVQIGGGYFVESPTGGPNWRLRLNLVVLIPRQTKTEKQ
jgi:hypothetical protein